MKKPRLWLDKGYWRVSPKPRPYWKYDQAWDYAHRLANYLNGVRNE